jgi:hypothetical protein
MLAVRRGNILKISRNFLDQDYIHPLETAETKTIVHRTGGGWNTETLGT